MGLGGALSGEASAKHLLFADFEKPESPSQGTALATTARRGRGCPGTAGARLKLCGAYVTHMVRPVSLVLRVCVLELVGLVLHGCTLEPVGLVLHGNMLEPVGLLLNEHLLEQVGLVLHILVCGVGAPARRVAGAAVNVARKQAQPSKDRPRARVFAKGLPLTLFPFSPSFPESLSIFEAGGRPGRLHRNSGSRMFGNDPSSCDRILFEFLRGTLL